MGLRRDPASWCCEDLAYSSQGGDNCSKKGMVRPAIAVCSPALAFALNLLQTTRGLAASRRSLPWSKGAVRRWMEKSLHSAAL